MLCYVQFAVDLTVFKVNVRSISCIKGKHVIIVAVKNTERTTIYYWAARRLSNVPKAVNDRNTKDTAFKEGYKNNCRTKTAEGHLRSKHDLCNSTFKPQPC